MLPANNYTPFPARYYPLAARPTPYLERQHGTRIIEPMPSISSYLNYRKRLKLRMDKPIDVRARLITLESKALGVTKRFYVALPPGYSSPQNANRRYPTLYLFRGHEHEWIHRWQDHSRQGRTVIDVYRELLHQGRVGPMIPGLSWNKQRRQSHTGSAGQFSRSRKGQ
jgi:hypothetical protein